MQYSLKPFKNTTTTVYTGRPQGIDVRQKLNLEACDRNNETIELVIPEDTTSFTPSFFLGLLYGSIQKLGMEKFKEKYRLIIATDDNELRKVLDTDIQDGFRNALNSLQKRTGLNSTF
jgi:hypothetical protein